MRTINTTLRILLTGAALALPPLALPAALYGAKDDGRPVEETRAGSTETRASLQGERRATSPSDRGAQSPQVVYRPPRLGSPSPDHRVGGGTRGGSALPLLVAIAPDHIGLTGRGQPCLPWYISEVDRGLPIMFTLIETDAIRPLLELELETPAQPGMQVIRLADYGVELVMGRSYEWSVSVVPDPEHRSRDIVATGMIRRVAPASRAAAQALPKADSVQALRISAAAGLWYDAMAGLVDMIQAAPHNDSLKREWSGLLQQGKLSDPVVWTVEGL